VSHALQRRAPRAARRRRERRRRLLVVGGVAGALLAALALASLRLEIFRLRYALAETVAVEQQLLERRRALVVEVARLRDPRRLRRIARERGFGLPERVIQLEGGGPPPIPVAAVGERP
jgi:hypothetical protein